MEGLIPGLESYRAIRSTISLCKKTTESKWYVPGNVVRLTEDDECVNEDYYEESDEDHCDLNKSDGSNENFNRACIGEVRRGYSTYGELLRDVTAPFCITGNLPVDRISNHETVYKTSNMEKLNIEELLAEATLSPFGKGSETVIDTKVRHSYEIDLSKSYLQLYWVTLSINLTAFASKGSEIELRPYKLVIYKEGGHFHAHRDTVRGENHIGTLVIILNSEYTGGELEVSHGGRTETVTGAYSWVAMYGDCLHKINPVTSGTRVSLIYDIYQKPRSQWEMRRGYVWDTDYWSRSPANSIPRGVNEAQRQAVIAGMHKQLHGFDSAAICLQHLYPACQANPDFLKGGDQLLFDLLRHDFALCVLPCTIYRRTIDEFMARSYGPEDAAFCVKPLELCRMPRDPVQVALAKEAVKWKTNFIMVSRLTCDHVLEREDIDYTGNEAQGEETLYLVAGLFVRRKVT